MLWLRILGGVAIAICLAALVEVWLKRGQAPRPLAERMRDGMKETADTTKPLGMEATDLEMVENAQKLNERSALKSHHVKFR
jgi:sensor c-di-GMP phosphodiesterase-like protein